MANTSIPCEVVLLQVANAMSGFANFCPQTLNCILFGVCNPVCMSHTPHFSMMLDEWGIIICVQPDTTSRILKERLSIFHHPHCLDQGLSLPNHQTCIALHTSLCTHFIQVPSCTLVCWQVTQHVSLLFQVNPHLWQKPLL